MRKPLLAYIYILSVAASALLMVFGRHMGRGDWPSLLLLSGAVVFFDLNISRMPSGQSFSFSYAVQLMAIFLSGLPTALWVAAIGNTADGLIRGLRSVQVVYNSAQMVTVVWLSGSVFTWLGGEYGARFDHPLAALVAGVIFLVANLGLIGRLFAFIHGKPFFAALREIMTAQFILTFSIGVVLGTMGAFLIVRGNWIWFLMAVTLLVLVRFSFSNYLHLLESANLRGQELEAVLNAARSAILVQSTDGSVRHVNRQLLQLVGLADSPDTWIGVPYQELANRSGPLLVMAQRESIQEADGHTQAILRVDLATPVFLDYYRGPIGAGTAGTIEVFTDITALKEAEERLLAAHAAMLRALTAAIDARDPYTHGHSARVADYSVLIGRHLGLSEEHLQRIHYAGLMHDIGKLGVDDRVLRKHGPLTPEERAAMMEHPVIGAQLLAKAGVFLELDAGVRYHHEWYNGGGYPEGLKEAEIPFDARIIGAADAFDAMTSNRPYRGALATEEAVRRLKTGRGIQFDPLVVDAFLRAYEAGEVNVERVPKQEAMGTPAQRPNESVESLSPDAGIIRPVHKKELSIFYRVARENYAGLDLPQMLRRILQICYDTVGSHNYMVFLFEDETRDLIMMAALGHAPDLGGIQRWESGQGLVGQVGATGKSLMVADVQSPPGHVSVLPNTRSECAVPLLHGGQVVGVLNVESPLSGALTEDDLYLFEALAQQVAGTVELARYHERLTHAASHDGLTGILNHSVFHERLASALKQSRRLGQCVSVVILDLNGMKAVNDTYGHLAGDRALQEWANLLRSQVREGDSVARYGGDEFTIIMPGAARPQASLVVERLARASVRTFSSDNRQIPLPQASYGVATYPEDGEQVTELVERADQRMYDDKGRRAPFPGPGAPIRPRLH